MRLTTDKDELYVAYIPAWIEADTLHLKRSEEFIFCIDHTYLRQSKEISVGIVETLFVIFVILHMLRLYIGHNRQIGVAVEKTLIALICLKNHFVIGIVAYI